MILLVAHFTTIDTFRWGATTIVAVVAVRAT
jgi:hypothetical protein